MILKLEEKFSKVFHKINIDNNNASLPMSDPKGTCNLFSPGKYQLMSRTFWKIQIEFSKYQNR